MTEYLNVNGNSGIVAYEVFDDAIDVAFESGGVYTYHRDVIGEVHFEVMKALAQAGTGLNAFINKHVRFRYSNRQFNTAPPTPSISVHVDSENAAAVIAELVRAGVKVSLN